MQASTEQSNQQAAQGQLIDLKGRLASYQHPLVSSTLASSKQLLQRARQRNAKDPWRFVLPETLEQKQERETASSDETSPNLHTSPSTSHEERDTFQSELRDSDNLKWLNTIDDQPLTMQDQLKGKFLVVDFWTSCCINCIHVLAELEELETKFEDFPEIAFIGVHSAKFDQEEAVHMLRQAVVRYDVKHPCINDCKFDVWNTFKLNNWPTLMIVGPDANIIYKTTEERNIESIEHILFAALSDFSERLENRLAKNEVPSILLDSRHLPVKLEKDKADEFRQQQKAQGVSSDETSLYGTQESITALRQNLSQPGKVLFIDSTRCQNLHGETVSVPLAGYPGVTQLLIIADSSNNRLVVVDAGTNRFLEQIGNGKNGYREGSFDQAEFSLPQGLCHFVNEEAEHCLMVCDVKNHLVREVNLSRGTVRHVAGLRGVRGNDTLGGELPATEQELASPWDIALTKSGEFMIAMAGTHQIWRLDILKDKCSRYSGSGSEGNANQNPETSTWAQPSGVTLGTFSGEEQIFVADSESSAVRALSTVTGIASNVAGANEDCLDLFDFGDAEGAGYSAKLQHPLGVHYCDVSKTLYVADTYNHKIKVMRQQEGTDDLTPDVPLLDWIGSSLEKTPKVVDGARQQALLNEPNGCWAKVSYHSKKFTIQASLAKQVTKASISQNSDGQVVFKGLYIADTGNDCVRFAHPDGTVETLDLLGVPDVRLTASDCAGGVCKFEFKPATSTKSPPEEEQKTEF